MPLDKNKIDDLNKTLFINIEIPNVPKPSFIRNYFGYLYKESSTELDSKRIYFKVCFEKIKEYPDKSFSSVRKNIVNYGTTSSIGNMRSHLLAVHEITEIQATKLTDKHVLSMFSRHWETTKYSQLKGQLGH